jgi:HPt (histidine-containing phosphotransfer) domain-containing protein
MAAEIGFAGQLAEDLSPGDLRHVLAVFRADVERLAEAMGVAARAGDIASFRRVAHGLAGAGGAVGAERLEQACRLAMTRADIGPPQLVAAHAAIATLCDAALGDMAAFLARLDGR